MPSLSRPARNSGFRSFVVPLLSQSAPILPSAETVLESTQNESPPASSNSSASNENDQPMMEQIDEDIFSSILARNIFPMQETEPINVVVALQKTPPKRRRLDIEELIPIWSPRRQFVGPTAASFRQMPKNFPAESSPVRRLFLGSLENNNDSPMTRLINLADELIEETETLPKGIDTNPLVAGVGRFDYLMKGFDVDLSDSVDESSEVDGDVVVAANVLAMSFDEDPMDDASLFSPLLGIQGNLVAHINEVILHGDGDGNGGQAPVNEEALSQPEGDKKCGGCPRTFAKTSDFANHLIDDHPGSGLRERTCVYCGTLFSDEYKCNSHVMSQCITEVEFPKMPRSIAPEKKKPPACPCCHRH